MRKRARPKRIRLEQPNVAVIRDVFRAELARRVALAERISRVVCLNERAAAATRALLEDDAFVAVLREEGLAAIPVSLMARMKACHR